MPPRYRGRVYGPRLLVVVVVASLAVTGCRGGATAPPPTTAPATPVSAPSPSETATTAPTPPSISAAAIPGLTPAAIHDKLQAMGFATSGPVSNGPSFVTITSTRADATVLTVGPTANEVTQVVVEANRPVAAAVLATVTGVILAPAEAKAAAKQLGLELKKPTSATEPRSSTATYGAQPYALLLTSSTATLTVGRIKAP